MNRQTGKKSIWQGLVLVTASLLAGFTQAAGLLTPGDGSLPALEIRDHQVEVLIEDGYAITTVEQVFFNPHDRDLEAQYSFPVPAHGSVVDPAQRGVVGLAKTVRVQIHDHFPGRLQGPLVLAPCPGHDLR